MYFLSEISKPNQACKWWEFENKDSIVCSPMRAPCVPPSFAFRNSQSRAFPRGFMPVGSLLYVFPRTPGTGEQGTHRSVECVCSLVCYTVAFLRVLHAPCIPCAFPVSSLAFPDRPAILSAYVPLWVPDGFPPTFPGIMLWILACVLQLVHFHTAHKPQGHHASVVQVTDEPYTYVPICSSSFCLHLFQRIRFRGWVYASFSITYVRGLSVKVQKIKLPNNITDVK